MLLPDSKIAHLCMTRGLVRPFEPENVQPASIDVRLGNHFKVFVPHGETVIDLNDPVDITKAVAISDQEHFVLHPGEFVLGVTRERVDMPNDLVGRVEGKSSLGRLGLIVHATAGYIDPGFSGRITLEMTNLLRVPILLRPRKLIAQISFSQLLHPAQKPYNGRYQGDLTVAASRYGQDLPLRD